MSITLEALGQALTDINQPADNVRQPAIELLHTWSKQFGYLSALLQIVAQQAVHLHTRIAAAIRIRKMILDKWKIGTIKNPQLSLIADSERETVKSTIIPIIIHESDPVIRTLLSEGVLCVARQDFPAKWPEALTPIVEVLSTQQNGISAPNQVYGALLCYYRLICVRHATIAANKKERTIQANLVDSCMPYILPLLQQLLAHEAQTIQGEDQNIIHFFFQTSHLIIKLISKQLQQIALPFYKNAQNVNTVSTCLLTVAKLSYPEFMQHLLQTHGERAMRHSLQKRRKWAFRVLRRLNNQVLRVTERNNKALITEQIKWNKAWHRAFHIPLYDVAISALGELTQCRHIMSEDLLYIVLAIIDNGIASKKKIFESKIIPNLTKIVDNIGIALMLTQQDIDTLSENPIGFIDRILSAGLSDSFSADYIQQSFIILKHISENVSPQQFNQCLEVLIIKRSQHFQEVKSQYNNQQLTTLSEQQLVNMMCYEDAAMCACGALAIALSQENHFQNTLHLLQNYLNQHLSGAPLSWPSPPILPIRAFWLVQKFSKTLIKYLSNPHFETSCTQVIQSTINAALSVLLPSPELKQFLNQSNANVAVTIQAASVLESLLALPQIRNLLQPSCHLLFASVLELCEQYDSETLSVLFQRLLVHYKDCLIPVAADLIARLVPRFLDTAKEIEGNDEFWDGPNEHGVWNNSADGEDDTEEVQQKFWAAQSFLVSMHTIIAAIEDTNEVLQVIQTHITPVIDYILDNNLTDFIEEALTIVQGLTYYKNQLTAEDWAIYPKLIRMSLGWGQDCYRYAIPSLANFISCDLNGFLAGTCTYIQDNDEPKQYTNLGLLYHLFETHFAITELDVDALQAQESSIFLLRAHIGWLPKESDLQPGQAENFVQHLVTMLVPQILQALRYTDLTGAPIPSIPTDNTEAEETNNKLKRYKYALLVLDCISVLIYKFPTLVIPRFLSTDLSQAIGQPMNLLELLFDAYRQVLPDASREQSVFSSVVGLGTTLAFLSQPDYDNQQISALRTNLVSLLSSAMLRFREIEAMEDEENEDDNFGYHSDDDNDELLTGGVDDDGDDGFDAETEADRQDEHLAEFARLAREMHHAATQDLYFYDFDLTCPVDHMNHFAMFLSALQTWSSASFSHRSSYENDILATFNNPASPQHEHFQTLMVYAEESRVQWEQDRQDEEAEWSDHQENRQKQLAQFRQQ